MGRTGRTGQIAGGLTAFLVLTALTGCATTASAPPRAAPARYLPETRAFDPPPDLPADPLAGARARVRVIDVEWPPVSEADPQTLLDAQGVLRVRPAASCALYSPYLPHGRARAGASTCWPAPAATVCAPRSGSGRHGRYGQGRWGGHRRW